MPSCVYRKCITYTKAGNSRKDVSFHLKCKTYTRTAGNSRKDVSFHSFPSDGLMKEKWAQIVRIQRREDDWMPTKYSTICSQHFLEDDKYETQKNCRKLLKTAVPVIKHEVNSGKINNKDDDSLKAVPVIKHEENSGEINIKDDNSLKDVCISYNDSIFDTPSNAYLKQEITKMKNAKKKLQMKNYNLAKQNKRLKERCDILQKIVSKLMKKKKSDP